jgi:hypothetical protein
LVSQQVELQVANSTGRKVIQLPKDGAGKQDSVKFFLADLNPKKK